MVKNIGRGLGGAFERDGDGVAIIRADAESVGGEAEAGVLTFGDDFFEKRSVEAFDLSLETGDEFIDAGPALGIECESSGAGIVPEHEAQATTNFVFDFAHGEALQVLGWSSES